MRRRAPPMPRLGSTSPPPALHRAARASARRAPFRDGGPAPPARDGAHLDPYTKDAPFIARAHGARAHTAPQLARAMAMNTCELNVGRLMEIRVESGYHCVRDVDAMIAMMRGHVARLRPAEKYVIVADWRRVGMMCPDTAARAREMLSRSNARIIRSAILTLPERSLGNLQVVRLVREAEMESRRHFTNGEALYHWLAEVLDEPERARLSVFLEHAIEPARGSVATSAPAPRHSLASRQSASQGLAPMSRRSPGPSSRK